MEILFRKIDSSSRHFIFPYTIENRFRKTFNSNPRLDHGGLFLPLNLLWEEGCIGRLHEREVVAGQTHVPYTYSNSFETRFNSATRLRPPSSIFARKHRSNEKCGCLSPPPFHVATLRRCSSLHGEKRVSDPRF